MLIKRISELARLATLVMVACLSGCHTQDGDKLRTTLSKDTLKDKIKGGWAAQTIGVTFGGPTELHFQGSFTHDNQPLQWYDGYLKASMENHPEMYDDIYMDLTFVDVLERIGLDSFAAAFATAAYPLWHANQAARRAMVL